LKFKIKYSNYEFDAISGQSASSLEMIHRQIYDRLDAIDSQIHYISNNEIIVASPGVPDTLVTEKDFLVFKVKFIIF